MPCSLDSLRAFLDDILRVREFSDEPNALNGLQVDATAGADQAAEIATVALSVDAAEAVIDEAIALKADLLLVHHGLFWGGLRPLVGSFGRKLRKCFGARLSVYSAHLPLDVHPTLGNNACLARALDFPVAGPFGNYRGIDVGLEVVCDVSPEELSALCASVLGTEVRLYGKGPRRVRRLGIVSGGGGSCLKQAAAQGLDAMLTGESAHHTVIDAEEAGIYLLLGGHYRTETFGVRALGDLIGAQFGIDVRFIGHDTGL
ncbi:MAG: Nif3-like dinuclear metal center hexameric protein [Myxococcales bacterium]|jgi:dinuclear metal center YbgI/SA1388 family protein|nr:Nif3-like dinuclear metal center hexameric protein [Myxococcales bacterium]